MLLLLLVVAVIDVVIEVIERISTLKILGFRLSKKNMGWTDERTDGQTRPLREERSRIKKKALLRCVS